jgi:hypothetical protein
VWKYLDTPLAGEPASLRSQLVQRWVHQGSVSLDNTPAARRKIDLLTRPISRNEAIPAADLGDRTEMLIDLRASISGMHDDVHALVEHVRAQRR